MTLELNPRNIVTVTENVNQVVIQQPNQIIISSVGLQGIQGETGEGVPTGGTTGQILAKNSNTNYDTEWTSELTNIDSILFDTTHSAAPQEGLLSWNATDGTLDLGLIGGTVNMQIGQEVVVRAKNDQGAIINNGDVVYISGADGNNPLIKLADADTVTANAVLGLATEQIAINGHGYVTTFGKVRDLNTNSFNAGDIVYLSETAGQLTTTPPVSPAKVIKVGTVLRKNINNGIVLVSVHAETDLSGYLTGESDPLFLASPAYSITGQNIIDLNNLSGVNTGDQDLSGYLTAETDPVFSASQAANITATHITNLNNLSGVNTGDQDLSGLVPNTRTINGKALSSDITLNSADVGAAEAIFFDMFNPMIDSTPHGNFTFNRIIAAVVATNMWKKYNNIVTFNQTQNLNNFITIYQAVAAAGTIRLGANNAFQNGIISAIASSWGLIFDLAGFNNSMNMPLTAAVSAYFIDNSSASPVTLTLSASGAASPNMGISNSGGGAINIVVTGTGTVSWSTTANSRIANNFGTYEANGSQVVDNNTILAKATQIILSGGNAYLHLSATDVSTKLRIQTGAVVYIRNVAINCVLASPFGNNTAGAASNASVLFFGNNTTNHTTLSGNNTWTGSTTLVGNAYLRLGHSNCLGTGLTLSFTTGSWRLDNSSGAPLTLTKNVTFSSAATLTFDGGNTLTFSGTHTLSAAVTIDTTGSVLSFDGNFTGAFLITKAGAGELYIKQTQGGITVNLGVAGCNSLGALTVANTVGATFKCVDHPVNGIISATTAVTLSGSNSRVMFSWNATANRFTYITTGTCALGNAGLVFSGAAVNGVYDIIVGAGTMSGTLPTVAGNTTGKSLALSQVGNTLRVTVS